MESKYLYESTLSKKIFIITAIRHTTNRLLNSFVCLYHQKELAPFAPYMETRVSLSLTS